jgi:hypothetical protein
MKQVTWSRVLTRGNGKLASTEIKSGIYVFLFFVLWKFIPSATNNGAENPIVGKLLYAIKDANTDRVYNGIKVFELLFLRMSHVQ